MGLDTTHDCWHGPYSAFNAWRRAIAAAVGMDLKLMVGFGGEVKWELLVPDPLHILLSHSDCDGEIPAPLCESLASRLEEVAATLPEDDWPLDYRGIAKSFVDGLRTAAARGEPVEFR